MRNQPFIRQTPLTPPRLVAGPTAIDNPILDFFLQYWDRKRGTDVVPNYRDFLPREVGKNLPWVVVVEALPHFSDFRYRVVGSHVCRYFAMNGAGKTVREAFDLLPNEIADDTIAMFRRTCEERMPLRLTAPSSRWSEIYYPEFDALYLPYASDSPLADRVVTIFTFNDDEFRQTRSQRGLTG
jgi:hypothetical protein